MKKFRNPEDVHNPLAGYSHQIEVTGHTRWLVLSGQLGIDDKGVLPDDPAKQLEIALENIVKNLRAADMGAEDLVKIVFYLVGNIERSARNQIISKALNNHKPCMTLLYVASLADPAFKVEIEAWACSDE